MSGSQGGSAFLSNAVGQHYLSSPALRRTRKAEKVLRDTGPGDKFLLHQRKRPACA
ncbi:hypothetical protein WJR50_26965 [Catalinimonas sp. 4WD22]|uniref:hypothetical protein n=1 Tax=Catalinimonas locisalis TaxID=3133978 RepID=UPI00310193C8